ncbi:DNA mismatch repair protein [Podila verticillata]|nr:DNA mismatch repair protein [Podila verticillata]
MSADGVPTIKRLDEAVVNRIAAGEIIHRPANALKELIENSLDARSTAIQVSVKDGGLKLLQIQDNGHGIKPVSVMSHMSLSPPRPKTPIAHTTSYSDGVIIPAKLGAAAEPKPCAGNNGTQISAEDLFYNVPTRRKALKNATEEYNRILDIVNRYAIHNAGVSFTCRKIGSNTPDVHTTNAASVVDNIRQIYGSSVANELLYVEQSYPVYPLKIKGWISNANYSVKKFAFLLFINHRSVDSPAIRKAIEGVYTAYLPKNTHPWVYLSLELDPRNVDVNVHPTKREVHFMNEEEIIATICDSIQERLGDANVSRNFMTQTLLPQLGQPSKLRPEESSFKKAESSTHKRVKLGAGDDMDDTEMDEDESMADVNDGSDSTTSGSLLSKIDQFRNNIAKNVGEAGSNTHGKIVNSSPSSRSGGGDDGTKQRQSTLRTKSTRVEVRLTSVLQLREEVKKQGHPVLTPIFANHTFVGILDNQRGLIQNELALYLVHFEAVSEELFYQICLRDFSNFGFIRLSNPASIKEMVLMALDDEQELMETTEWPTELKSKDEIAKTVTNMLVSRREMLREYFSLCITEDGLVSAIPMMIKGYIPNMEKLPDLLWRLGSEVNWSAEKECFQTLCREIAIFYSTQPERVAEEEQDLDFEEGGDHPTSKSAQSVHDARFQHMISTVIFPALKKHFVPPKTLIERSGVVVQVAQVKDLYKVFERC